MESELRMTLMQLSEIRLELAAVTEQRDKALQKIKNQAERIAYLEGATNHATGTPLSKAIEQRDKLAAGLEVAQQVGIQLGEQRDRLAEALEQWQPIETAPKDRSFILSAHPEHGYLITRWLGAREMWDGWAIEPTHWMSLPKLTTP